jgi:hypothetical protein
MVHRLTSRVQLWLQRVGLACFFTVAVYSNDLLEAGGDAYCSS